MSIRLSLVTLYFDFSFGTQCLLSSAPFCYCRTFRRLHICLFCFERSSQVRTAEITIVASDSVAVLALCRATTLEAEVCPPVIHFVSHRMARLGLAPRFLCAIALVVLLHITAFDRRAVLILDRFCPFDHLFELDLIAAS